MPLTTFFKPTHTVLGYPRGLFFLFFTEMWERFSYYGMRSLLVLFLVSSLQEGGWGWARDHALNLYGSYTAWVYVTCILGGVIADKILGTKKAVMLGGFIIAAGHAALAFDTHTSFYLGLLLLITGTGLFKPNISTIVGQLYGSGALENEKRDAAYTLFYMGVNSGAFFGIALCGYIGEKISWSYGFGLAGIFMLLGATQFYFAQTVFEQPSNNHNDNTCLSEQAEPSHIIRDRLIVIAFFSVLSIFFWMAFEQGGGSMTIFAADYTNRVLNGTEAIIFKWANMLLLIIPITILSYVATCLARATFQSYRIANLLISSCMIIIWILLLWMLTREFNTPQPEIPATWFGILNPFFIIVLSPLYSLFWKKTYNPTGPIKFAIGLLLLGLGFGMLSYGANGIHPGAQTGTVSIIWLILAHLLLTMSELCISPIGLSYVSKLSPKHLLGLMFGVWFIMTAVANKLAGLTGSFIDTISAHYSLSIFFLMFTGFSVLGALVLILMNKWIVRKMHGIV